jgi:hypothetical protein
MVDRPDEQRQRKLLVTCQLCKHKWEITVDAYFGPPAPSTIFCDECADRIGEPRVAEEPA